MGTVILDIGHRGDMSEGMGAEHQGYLEGELVPVYVVHAAMTLVEMGHDTKIFPYQDEPYAVRVYKAIHRARCSPHGSGPYAYVQCHLNAGAANYAVTFHAVDSHRPLASAIAESLGELSALESSKVFATQPEGWTSRAGWCLQGAEEAPEGMALVLVEPAFLDQPAHHSLLTGEGLRRIGMALARGIHTWLSEAT